MKNNYECVVIGGGLAGSTVAYYLAQFGYKVAVLEKSWAAHHKVCGEFLSFEALVLLKEMGIVLSNDAPIVKYFQLYSPHAQANFTFPLAGRGVSRYKLDEDLLNNTKDNGVQVYRGACMSDYHKLEDGTFKVETNRGEFYARHLFMAIGKHDISKKHRRLGQDSSYIGFKTHLRLRPSLGQEYRDTTVLFTFPGGYGGICPVEGVVTNFCFIIEKDVYKALQGNFQAAVAFLRRSNPQLDLILQQADFIETVSAVGHIPYGFLCPPLSQDGVYFLGDQRMVIPSFTGDGMAIALSTAKECAYEFNSHQKGLKGQTQPMQRVLQDQMCWAFLGHAILKSSWLIDLCAMVPGLKSFLIGTIFKKTRISNSGKEGYDHRGKVHENSYSGY